MDRGPYPQFLSLSMLLRGWALAQLGRVEEGMQTLADALQMALSIQVQLMVPLGLSLLAEIHMITGKIEDALIWLHTGLEVAAGTNEAFALSYLLGVKAELLLGQGAAWTEAETVFLEAVEIARRQQNRWLELRTLLRYARMALRHAGEPAQRGVLHALESAYTSLSEGFDLPDMQAAAALLGRTKPSGQPSGLVS
jgi:predicted ATPase